MSYDVTNCVLNGAPTSPNPHDVRGTHRGARHVVGFEDGARDTGRHLNDSRHSDFGQIISLEDDEAHDTGHLNDSAHHSTQLHVNVRTE